MLYIVGGKYKKKRLATPKSDEVRPTTGKVREAFFNICQWEIEGAYFLDLFAGSGVMGLEALSRGAKHVTFVDQKRASALVIKKNIETLSVQKQTTVVVGDVEKMLPYLKGPFDLIYADPPYGKGMGTDLLDAIDHNLVLAEGGRLYIEESVLQEPPLKHLELKKKRSFGRATLFEYGYRTDSRNI